MKVLEEKATARDARIQRANNRECLKSDSVCRKHFFYFLTVFHKQGFKMVEYYLRHSKYASND